MTFHTPIQDACNRFVDFVVEREAIRLRREKGQPWPWTTDPILGAYRFCNIHREDDAVTKWIRVNWREPRASEPDLWHLMCIARLFNEPRTLGLLDEIGHSGGDTKNFKKRLRERQAKGQRVFNPAYMITTAGKKQDKIDYVLELLDSLWDARERLRPRAGDTLRSFHMNLGMFSGLGSFLAGQVVADMRYVHPLNIASDLQTFAASGPGSRRGLNRIRDRAVNHAWTEDEWHSDLMKLARWVGPPLKRHGIELHAQDVQNCLCEYDKMERARLGEGRPKQRYRVVNR